MTSRPRGVALVAALTLIVAACGSTTSPPPTAARPSGSSSSAILPLAINDGDRVGDNRILSTLTDPTGQKQVAGPDRSLSIGYHGPKGETIPPVAQTFIWAVEGQNGVYVGRASFPSDGEWT